MSINAIAIWDFTLKAEGLEDMEVTSFLRQIAKEWKCQLECGEQGNYMHYQGRFSLYKKKRKNELINLVRHTIFEIAFFSPTSGNGRLSNYVMKLDTRMRGPWSSDDPEPMYIPRQIREIQILYPWQQSIVDRCAEWNTRLINVVYDTEGNCGKSTLVGYMRVNNLGRKLPACNDYKDLMRMVCDMPTSRCYLIDMPRAMKKDKLAGLFTGIEEIKSGYAYDDRYKFTEKFFDCPNIWIFSNHIPDKNFVSNDRWKIWTINKYSKQLCEYSPEDRDIPSDYDDVDD